MEELKFRNPQLDGETMDETQQQAIAVVELAAENAERFGICKNALHDEDGRSCLWGHIDNAFRVSDIKVNNRAVVYNLIYRQLMAMFPSVYASQFQFPGAEFNDLWDTTETDVAKVLLEVRDRIAVL